MFPETLLHLVHSSRIIPFIGAGVSMAVRKADGTGALFPSWRDLLRQSATHLERENKAPYATLVRSLLEIEKPDYKRAAEYAKDGLGASWYTFLKSVFDHPMDAADPETLQLARIVWRLRSKLLITTNYDRVLRWACPSTADCAIWNIEAPAEQALLVKEGLRHPVVWHLHGTIDDSANLVLTPDSYERVYPTDTTKNRLTAALETLRSLLASHSFLFIGYGLGDQELGLHLRSVTEAFAGAAGPHYALVNEITATSLRSANFRGVELITYRDHAELPSVIELLSQSAATVDKDTAVTLNSDEREGVHSSGRAPSFYSDTPPLASHGSGE